MNVLRNLFKTTLGVFAVLLIITACSDDKIDAITDFGYSYFPMEVGDYFIYQLDSIRYDDFNDTTIRTSMLVREINESLFVDAGGRESFRIQREYKLNENDEWGSYGFDIWFAYKDESTAERVEENLRFVKLSFPLRLGRSWLGNIHIDTRPVDVDSGVLENPNSWLDGWEYTITSIDEAYSNDNLSFDSTLTVIQEATGTLLDTTGSREIYAKNVGLIYKDLYKLKTQCIANCIGMSWEDKAEKGFIIKQRLLEYGQL